MHSDRHSQEKISLASQLKFTASAASFSSVSGPNKQQHFTISRHASPRGAFLFYVVTLTTL